MSSKGTTANPYNVLFLCTGNSARSVLAEAILNRTGAPKFKAYSAGSHPKGVVNPHAITFLKRHDFATDGFRSKSWDEFAAPRAPKLDCVITVCDNAANEVCPIWPGHPSKLHWSIPDPAAVKGSDAEIAQAFAHAYRLLEDRIESFRNTALRSIS